MANTSYTPGSGDKLASDTITYDSEQAQLPLGKLVLGAAGSFETISRGQQTMANSLPVAIASNQGALDVSVTTALPAGTNNIGDVDIASLPSIPAGTNNIGDVDVLTLPSIPAGNNNIGDVDIASLPAPLSTSGAGTATNALRVVHASDDPVTVGVQLLDDAVATNGTAIPSKSILFSGSDGTNARPLATDASGRIVPIGAQAIGATLTVDPLIMGAQTRTSRRSGASNNTLQYLTLDDLGNLIIRDTAFASDVWSYSGIITSSSLQNVKALASGLRQWITGMQFTNDGADAMRVTVQDTAGTPVVLWRGLLPAGGGIVVPLPKPLMSATGVGIDIILSRAPGGTAPSGGTAAVLANLQGYQGV